ncbi:MAG: hypothetical protein WA989_15025 [Henriciella sp.]|uniref:hypothetical protein n=1 Tax=Henriciella sp. TaxID=1968823 RepID=UPI003C749F8C
MTDEEDPHRERATLDEKGKPRTSRETNEQIEAQKKLRHTGRFPPETPDRDDDVEHSLERASWDRLKAGKPASSTPG